MENISKLKMKNIFKNPQNKQTLQTKNENSENDKLLPKKRQKAEKKVNDLKNKLVSFTDCIQKTKKSKKQLSSVEQIFTNLLRNKRYWDACDFIFNQQQHDKHAYSGYKMVADDMWNTVRMALTGDNSQTEHLNSVAACVKWAKEENLTYEAEFSPNSWPKDLENIFIQYIKENIPTVKYDTDVKINLENHLEELKSKSLQQVNMTRSLLGDLYPLYLKCFTHYMHDHLSILASNQFNFEEYVLLYIWANKEWNRQLAYQHETEDFDHLLFKKWFENTGEKIIHTGKQTIIKVLTEILQREMDWNSYLKTELSYYFNDISKELDKVNNAVKDLGDTLRSGIKSLCWDEFDNFIKRYNTFLTNKIDKTVSLNEVHVILRSVKNCQILRKAQENLGKAPENKNDLNNKITESETHVIKQLPSALKSSLKRSFEKYFENNSTEFENILEKLQPEVAQIQNNEMIIKIIHCTVVALYIQTFINYYMDTSHSNVCEIFSKGSKDLQNIFKALVPVTVKLDNPMEFISQILESKDTGTESLEVTTCAFVHQHPDLREEHLKAIMDIKGNINWKQREKLLYFVKEQKAPTPDDQMLFFNEVEVKSSWWNWFCCCC